MKIIITEIVEKQLKGINNKTIDFNVKVKDELVFGNVIDCYNKIKELSYKLNDVNMTVECDQYEWETLLNYINKEIT